MKLMQSTAVLIGLSLATSSAAAAQEAPGVWLSTELIGMKVVSQQGDSVGKIEDIVVHPGNKPSYVVLSLGNWSGVGDKLFALPWKMLREVEATPATREGPRSLMLPLAKDKLARAPAFDKKSWPDIANPEWVKDVDEFYAGDLNTDSKRVVEAGVHSPALVWRATELRGTNVLTPDGAKLGDLEEFAIDTNGRVSYVTMSVGGFLGISERHVAVPWDSLRFAMGGDDGDKKRITLASTKDQLERAPQFKSAADARMQMCDPKWVQSVYQHYGCTAYWSTTRASAKPEVKPEVKPDARK